MKWDMDEEEHSGNYIVRMAMIMGVAVVVILGAVLLYNREPSSGRGKNSQTQGNIAVTVTEPAQESLQPDKSEENVSSGGRTSDELDIWNEDYASVLEETPIPTQNEENDVTTDGNHTMITYADGTTTWITISNRIKHNDYQNRNFVYQTPVMKYYEDGELVSSMGVMVGEDQNYVDYIKLKEAGVSFVMIRVGRRNAVNGNLEQDAQFAQNMKNAQDAGLMIGVWFESYARDRDEAVAEAQYVTERLAEYELQYPVACVLKPISGDGTDRAKLLNKDQRTEYARTFMTTVEQAGYRTILAANKEYLILKIDLTKMEEDDIWLLQPGDTPDYPYRFSMWSYDSGGMIEGIEKDAGLIIAMKDLSGL